MVRTVEHRAPAAGAKPVPWSFLAAWAASRVRERSRVGGAGLQAADARLRGRACAGFTMIEIAISLAVIGFALVAIVGVLPLGMGVQKENREETIINQDANMFLDAIRNGARRLDDLTNYVTKISVTRTLFRINQNGWQPPTPVGAPQTFDYTPTTSTTTPVYPLNQGLRVVGLLSLPKYTPVFNQPEQFYSNYVVAFFRSMSGPVVEKYPQDNSTMLDGAFSYRLVPELMPFAQHDQDWTNLTAFASYEQQWRSNAFVTAMNLQTNLHELRLIFRWPLLPNGDTGNGRLAFRVTTTGYLQCTNEIDSSTNDLVTTKPEFMLHFLEPRTFVRAKLFNEP